MKNGKVQRIDHVAMLNLKRWNTPTIYNGWEQVTTHDIARDGFNLEETRDFMPQMGPMVGRAVTVVIEPSKVAHKKKWPTAYDEYLEYVASCAPGPNIVVVQDLDKPEVLGSFWGEVNSNVHRALGCVGTITDGGIRDLDEMNAAGFKALARRLCVGHAHSFVVRFNCPVTVFGRKIVPGQLIHADKHGFLAIPPEDEAGLLNASRFMDQNECSSVITAAQLTAGKPMPEVLAALKSSRVSFGTQVKERMGRQGEW